MDIIEEVELLEGVEDCCTVTVDADVLSFLIREKVSMFVVRVSLG